MLLSELDLGRLENVTDPERWGINTHHDRWLYRDEHYYYKVWGELFIEKMRGAVGTEFRLLPGVKGIHGFEVGLFRPDICRAFRELIRDGQGRVRGYITRRGTHPDEVPDEFADRVFEAGLECGWLYSDLKRENVVIVDGVCSLIDYDTHLTSFEHLDPGFEAVNGCLRPHVVPRYRERILDAIQTNTSVISDQRVGNLT